MPYLTDSFPYPPVSGDQPAPATCFGELPKSMLRDSIEEAVLTVYRRHESGHPMRISTAGVEAYDRKALARKLADTLSAVQISSARVGR